MEDVVIIFPGVFVSFSFCLSLLWLLAVVWPCKRGKNASAVKYTAVTFVSNTSTHWEGDSFFQREAAVSLADEVVVEGEEDEEEESSSCGMGALVPAMPALQIRRSRWDSFSESVAERLARESLDVTSHGPMLLYFVWQVSYHLVLGSMYGK